MASPKTRDRTRRQKQERLKQKGQQENAALANRPVSRGELGQEIQRIERELNEMQGQLRGFGMALSIIKKLVSERLGVTDEHLARVAMEVRVEQARADLMELQRMGVGREKVLHFCLQSGIDPTKFPDLIPPEEEPPHDGTE